MATEFECQDWSQFVRMIEWAARLGLMPRIGMSKYVPNSFVVFWK
jgi:hypothetical protein